MSGNSQASKTIGNTIVWELDGNALEIKVLLSARKTTVITINPDLQVGFRGSISLGEEDIRSILDRKRALIRKKLEFFKQYHPRAPEFSYEKGETLYYLGRQYRFMIEASATARIRLLGQWLRLELPEPENKDRAKRMVDMWFRARAIVFLSQRYNELYETVKHDFSPKPELRFRKMKKRWGSCGNGVILLNTEMIKTPPACIDYIIMHELCHVKYKQHNKKFYNKLTHYMPDWMQRKRRLERSIL